MRGAVSGARHVAVARHRRGGALAGASGAADRHRLAGWRGVAGRSDRRRPGTHRSARTVRSTGRRRRIARLARRPARQRGSRLGSPPADAGRRHSSCAGASPSAVTLSGKSAPHMPGPSIGSILRADADLDRARFQAGDFGIVPPGARSPSMEKLRPQPASASSTSAPAMEKPQPTLHARKMRAVSLTRLQRCGRANSLRIRNRSPACACRPAGERPARQSQARRRHVHSAAKHACNFAAAGHCASGKRANSASICRANRAAICPMHQRFCTGIFLAVQIFASAINRLPSPFRPRMTCAANFACRHVQPLRRHTRFMLADKPYQQGRHLPWTLP